MKAVRIHEFDGLDVLRYEEAPEPQPGPGQIRLRIMAAGVNPVDWKIREGKAGKPPLPLTMGIDGAGVVDLLGDGVTDFQPGDRVFAKTDIGEGTYAEYAVTSAANAARIPPSVDFIAAASIPTAGLTAWQALLDIAGLQAGQTVLIHGAAGGVGSFAVQFANWKGARVIGTASGSNVPWVIQMCADQVINYHQQRFDEVVHDVDVVLDTIGGEVLKRSWRVLKPGGFLVSTVAAIPEDEAAAHGVRAALMYAHADSGELARIAQLIEERKVKPIVTTVLPLADARQAQEMSQAGHTRGKIVLTVVE